MKSSEIVCAASLLAAACAPSDAQVFHSSAGDLVVETVARRLRAGFIGLNGTAGYGADVPFGGYKDSGVGRQNGLEGFSQYTEVKSVAYPADEG